MDKLVDWKDFRLKGLYWLWEWISGDGGVTYMSLLIKLTIFTVNSPSLEPTTIYYNYNSLIFHQRAPMPLTTDHPTETWQIRPCLVINIHSLYIAVHDHTLDMQTLVKEQIRTNIDSSTLLCHIMSDIKDQRQPTSIQYVNDSVSF